MRTKRGQLRAFFLLLTILTTSACSTPPRAPDLGGLYNELARNEDPYRNLVILIPGILGSKLVDRPSNVVGWGAFGLGSANPTLFSDHRNLTNDPAFTDNLLYILLESPREKPSN